MNKHRRPFAFLAVLAAFAFGITIGFLTGSASAASPQPARTVTVAPATMPGYQPLPTPVPVVSGNG